MVRLGLKNGLGVHKRNGGTAWPGRRCGAGARLRAREKSKEKSKGGIEDKVLNW